MTPGGIRVYEQTRVTTAGQGELILLLHDGAITALRQAAEEIRLRHYETKGNLLNRARRMIEELWAALNPGAGPIAGSLESLYNYMVRRILYINSELDAKGAEELARLLSELREAWESAIEQTSAAKETSEKVRLGARDAGRVSGLQAGVRG